MTNPDRPSDVGVDEILLKLVDTPVRYDFPADTYRALPGSINTAKAAILQWHRREMLAEVIALIGEDEPEEERPYNIQYRDFPERDLTEFVSAHSRNDLRAQLREAAVRRWGDKS